MDDGAKAAVLIGGTGTIAGALYWVIRRVFGPPPREAGNTDDLDVDEPGPSTSSSDHSSGHHS